VFIGYERQILRTVFRGQCDEIKRHRLGPLFGELVFAIRHDFVKRDLAEEFFTLSWQIFRRRDLVELLIPPGRSLAWSQNALEASSLCSNRSEERGPNCLYKPQFL
jgi:hypothetical protein